MSSIHAENLNSHIDLHQLSNRMKDTENPYIEDVLDKYCNIQNITILALGSSHWNPPANALNKLSVSLNAREMHRYGNIQGSPALRGLIAKDLENKGIDMNDLDVLITAGANQGFTSVALSLIDPGDPVGKLSLSSPTFFHHLILIQF